MNNKIYKLIEILETSVDYADRTASEVVSFRFTKGLAQIFIKELKTFLRDYTTDEELKEQNKTIKKELDKAISENKVKSIEFKLKNEVQNSMIFNQIACILEKIREQTKE